MQFTFGKEDIVLYYFVYCIRKINENEKKKSIKENILDRKVS